MKTGILTISMVILALVAGCGQSSNKSLLSPQAFADKIKAVRDTKIIDVRTPEEFSDGHIASAVNFDWSGDHFEHQVMGLDKSKPVFVYCLSGSRSASAAKKMRSMGFQQVYELDGGLYKWQSARLPLTKD